ncbi:DNA repair protein RecN [Enterovirga rhinocerotis]|uniref:DNA repair protein RecN n=1 Tax=Enterovirga rhinocerotis TaxID=1339210 RepID=A0A4R7BWH9_9HYPH|nr:DNA repair protein RecN [Enterovirga rhinocerotis]TDR89035.1 DNA replication and repair protein RecN [Enterovirga rhinocerotis]
MLAQLSIRNIVLIDRLDLRFAPGLSVLTGETGAGKSILLDAFALALGSRGDGSLVRHGETQGQVSAVFDVAADHPARALAVAADLDIDGDLILRRVQFADGRTRALVNDQPVSVQTLREMGAALVEIHGQHADRALVDPSTHRAILDAHGGLVPQAQAVATAARRLRQAKAALGEAEERLALLRKEQDYIDHAVAELTALAPEPGEEAALGERRQVMQQAEKVAQELQDAAEAVAAPIGSLSAAIRKLERRSGAAESLVARPIAALDALLLALDEADRSVAEAIRAAEFDPADLERTEERLFKLRAASRKFSVPADDLAALRDRFGADQAAIGAGEAEVSRFAAETAQAETDYVAAAEKLSAGRSKAAARLDKAVAAELAPLKLGSARFLTQVETDPASRDSGGRDRVEFWVETNPGTRPGPMMKVASGGELSRFILALKVVLAERGSAPTLVFDEIDTGVGGAVSDAIGQRLARLAARVQVMAVTHAPQVAARAGTHFLIAKQGGPKSQRVATSVEALEPVSRREEIARMLAGASVTDEARAAATRLIEAAGD